MTGLQFALISGGLIGLGAAGLLWRLTPAHPDLAAALERLAPERSLARPAAVPTTGSATSAEDRVGLWVMRTLPLGGWTRLPRRELALLRIPVHRFYGQKVLYFALGVAFPSAALALLALFGLTLPLAVPVLASLAFGVALSFLPDYNVRSDPLCQA